MTDDEQKAIRTSEELKAFRAKRKRIAESRPPPERIVHGGIARFKQPAELPAPSPDPTEEFDKPRPNWEFWSNKGEAELWQAVCLSLNVEPPSRYPEFRHGIFSSTKELNRLKRLGYIQREAVAISRLLAGSLRPARGMMGMNDANMPHRVSVRLADFAAFAASLPAPWALPPEFARLAQPAPSAAPPKPDDGLFLSADSPPDHPGKISTWENYPGFRQAPAVQLQQPEFPKPCDSEQQTETAAAAPAPQEGSSSPAERIRTDDIWTEIDLAIAELEQRSKRITAATVMPLLRAKAGRPESCISEVAADGVIWIRPSTGRPDKLTMEALKKRIIRDKERAKKGR